MTKWTAGSDSATLIVRRLELSCRGLANFFSSRRKKIIGLAPERNLPKFAAQRVLEVAGV